MSLNVYLTGKTEDVECDCPVCGHAHTRVITEGFFSANITHNLGRMAEEAGIYGIVWCPEENGIDKAAQSIAPLTTAMALMKSDRTRFEAFNSPNGWGLYENFLPWLEEYLAACIEYPEANVTVSR